jgi:hydroxymethylbilane synthase
MRDRLVIGTRKSALALWQSGFIQGSLEKLFPQLRVELKHIITTGDKTQDSNAAIPEIGGKGLFTAELEEALLAHEIDIAVHSLKDLPTILAPAFIIGAIPARGPEGDVVISRSGKKLEDLPPGATVGTSSLRRSSQILNLRPDLKALHIRGNVDTRLRKLRAEKGEYDAIVLAHAGLARLGLEAEITERLTFEQMVPAPGQGALAIECRADDAELLRMLSKLHDAPTASAVTAERVFLRELGAGCNTPVAAHAFIEARGSADYVVFRGRCLSPDGTRVLEAHGEARVGEEEKLGITMARDILSRGFHKVCAS